MNQKTSMQELIEVIYAAKQATLKDIKFSHLDVEDLNFKISLDEMVDFLNNAYSIEATKLSNAFDYGYLQAELKQNAEVTSGDEYVNKFYQKNADISSKV
jgi:hypothetical protein